MATSNFASASAINTIIAVGSIDGVLTTAAALRCIGGDVDVIFTQAFTVDKIDVSSWKPGRNVLFIDLAVNNQDETMTSDFVYSIINGGHEIIGVCDEHDAEAWERVFEETGINAQSLCIKPCSQKVKGEFESSGALFAATFAEDLDDYALELCSQADQADHFDFSGKFADLANRSVKSKIADNGRRVHIAKVLSQGEEESFDDKKISEWICEYKSILENHKEILASGEDYGSGIKNLNCDGKTVDMTTLIRSAYALPGVKVVIVTGQRYNKALKRKTVQCSFGTKDKGLDLLAAIKAKGVNAGGFAQKATVSPEDFEKSLQAVQELLKA